MISREPPPEAVAPLPIVATIAESYRLIAANFATLAKLSVIPFVLTLLVEGLASPFDSVARKLVWEFGLEVPWTLLTVPWLHCLLLAPRGAKAAFFPRLDGRHLRVLGYALLLSVLSLPLTFFEELAGAAIPPDEPLHDLLYWLTYAAIVYVVLRFSFVYAALAAGEDYSLGHSWRHTRGIGFNLFIAVGIATLLPWQLFTLLLRALAQQDQLVLVGVGFIWHAGLWLLEGAFLAFVAVAFRRCTGWVPPPNREIVERFE